MIPRRGRTCPRASARSAHPLTSKHQQLGADNLYLTSSSPLYHLIPGCISFDRNDCSHAILPVDEEVLHLMTANQASVLVYSTPSLICTNKPCDLRVFSFAWMVGSFL